MTAQEKEHGRFCDRDHNAELEALPADPDSPEFSDGICRYPLLMAPPDRWLWIPSG